MNEIMDEINLSPGSAAKNELPAGAGRAQIELTSLLYENLPYINLEDISEAIYYAAAGNEKELLRLLRHRANR